MQTSIYARGALRSHLVAKLSGTSPAQLSRWHRSGLIVASVLPGGRGLRRLYSWIEYSKVRAAVKLLEQRLPRSRLKPNLLLLEQELPEWYCLPLLAYQKHVIVPVDDGIGYTIQDKQAALTDLVEGADLRRRSAVEDDFDQAIRAVRAMQHEGPLGVMRTFGHHVTMDPAVVGGNPVLIGTRLETAMIAAIHAKGFQKTPMIAQRFDLSEAQVHSAVAFEEAIKAQGSMSALPVG